MAAQAVVKVVTEVTKKVIETAIKKTTAKIAGQALKQTAGQAVKQGIKQGTEQAVKQGVQQTAQETSKEVTKEVTQTEVKQVLKENPQELGKQTLGGPEKGIQSSQPKADASAEKGKSASNGKDSNLVADQTNMSQGGKDAMNKFKDAKDNVDRLGSSISDACDGLSQSKEGLTEANEKTPQKLAEGIKKFAIDAPLGAAKGMGSKAAGQNMDRAQQAGRGFNKDTAKDLLQGNKTAGEEKDEKERT